MYVSCSTCWYDSDDRDTPDELANKVNADGGSMTRSFTADGEPDGWIITCPRDHTGDSIHLD